MSSNIEKNDIFTIERRMDIVVPNKPIDSGTIEEAYKYIGHPRYSKS
jgi:hypothetical protein